jgi:hypothetical protein
VFEILRPKRIKPESLRDLELPGHFRHAIIIAGINDTSRISP